MAGKTSKKSAKVAKKAAAKRVARKDDARENSQREPHMSTSIGATSLSLMLAVPDATAAVAWYRKALGATVLWDLSGVAGLEIEGAPFFVGQPEGNGWDTPGTLGSTTLRIELFCDDPDAVIERAVSAGAIRGRHAIRNHQMPWGTHRQGGFVDPFGHIWFVGDKSPLHRFPAEQGLWKEAVRSRHVTVVPSSNLSSGVNAMNKAFQESAKVTRRRPPSESLRRRGHR